MTKQLLLLLCLFFSFAHTTLADNQNELPMYGGVEKTAQMKEADAALFSAIEKAGLTREAAADSATRAGFSYFQKKDLSTAIKRFNQAWFLDPENGEAYHGFALVTAERHGQDSEVEKYFLIAISKNKKNANTLVDFGRFLAHQNRLDESLIQLEKSLAMSNTAYNARSNISFVYYKKSEFKKACEWAKEAKTNQDELEFGYLEDVCRR